MANHDHIIKTGENYFAGTRTEADSTGKVEESGRRSWQNKPEVKFTPANGGEPVVLHGAAASEAMEAMRNAMYDNKPSSPHETAEQIIHRVVEHNTNRGGNGR